MICEFLLLYSTVYMLFYSVKSCCGWSSSEDTDATGIVLISPVVTYRDLGEKTRGQCGDECCICLDPFMPSTLVNLLPCNHFLCHACYSQWIKVNLIKEAPIRCPLCNQVLNESGATKGAEDFLALLPPSTHYSSSSLY